MKHVWICINGILTNPGDAEGWTDRAVTWLHLHTESRAEKFEYACGPLLRRLRQQWRAQAIARMVRFYYDAGFDVSFLAHSNGCDLVARVLGLLTIEQIRSAHLVAAATDGVALDTALAGGWLERLHLYGSHHDRALQIARLSSQLLGRLGLGYGSIGGNVAEWAAERVARGRAVHAHPDNTQGHSSWWERGVPFERTMQLILENERSHLA